MRIRIRVGVVKVLKSKMTHLVMLILIIEVEGVMCYYTLGFSLRK
jgi:hypothetical protein